MHECLLGFWHSTVPTLLPHHITITLLSLVRNVCADVHKFDLCQFIRCAIDPLLARAPFYCGWMHENVACTCETYGIVIWARIARELCHALRIRRIITQP